MSGATILVADDDKAIRVVLTQALGREGHLVRSTSNAATLWQWVSSGEGDLVITDVIMPDENGLDLIPRIRNLRPDLKIVVMSAQSTLLTAVKATERGAFEYLPKPFDLRELDRSRLEAVSRPAARCARDYHVDVLRLQTAPPQPAEQALRQDVGTVTPAGTGRGRVESTEAAAHARQDLRVSLSRSLFALEHQHCRAFCR